MTFQDSSNWDKSLSYPIHGCGVQVVEGAKVSMGVLWPHVCPRRMPEMSEGDVMLLALTFGGVDPGNCLEQVRMNYEVDKKPS